MTVTSTFSAQVKPGRGEDALALCRSAAKPLERSGAKNVRLLRGAVSSESYGAIALTMEYDSGEAWGESYDRVMADDELLTLMGQANSEDSPYLTQALSTAEELPNDGPKGTG